MLVRSALGSGKLGREAGECRLEAKRADGVKSHGHFLFVSVMATIAHGLALRGLRVERMACTSTKGRRESYRFSIIHFALALRSAQMPFGSGRPSSAILSAAARSRVSVLILLKL